MFLCKVKLQSSLHHIIYAVLLAVESSFTAAANNTVTTTVSVQHHSTQTNCLSCNVSSNATAENDFRSTFSKAPTLPPAINLTFTPTKTLAEVNSTLTVPTDHPALQPKTARGPTALTPSNSTIQTARTGTSAAAANPLKNVTETTSPVTSDSRMTTDATHETTAKTVNETKATTTSVTNGTVTTTVKTTATHTTGRLATTTTSTSPPLSSSPSSSSSSSNATIQLIPSTGSTLAPTTTVVTTLPSTTTVSSATTPEMTTTSHSELAPSETTAAMVEVLGDALSRQLASTALLLAVLVCGSLLFVISVMLFVRQAYQSYNRKDYSQVDYLINGMYSDSSL